MSDQAASSSTNGSGTQPSWSQQSSASGFDAQFIIKKVQLVLTDPKGCWGQLKAESITEKDLIWKFLVIMCAIPAVAQFLRTVVLGIKIPLLDVYTRMPFFSGLIYNFVYYVCSIAMVYVGAVIIEKLSPKFSGSADRVTSLKLISYSYIPGFLAGIATILPGYILQVLGGLFGLYGLYLFFQGITPMTGVPQNKRIGFFLAFIACMIVTGIILFGVVGSIFYPSIDTTTLSNPGNVNINFQDLGKEIDKFQKMIPNPNK